MAFDPDAYLKTPAAKPAFDPDAYLKAKPETPADIDKRHLSMGVPSRGNYQPEQSPQPQTSRVMDAVQAGARTAGNIAGSMGGGIVGAFAGATDFADTAIKHARGQDTSKVQLRGPDEGAQAANEGISGIMDMIFGKQSQRSQDMQEAPGRALDKLGVRPESLMMSPYGMGGAALPGALSEANQAFGPAAAARGAQGSLKSGARSLMQSALKPSLEAQRTGKAATAIDTLLDTRTNVTRAGADKLQARITDLNQQIADKIANSKAVVDKQTVADNLKGLMEDFSKQVNPNSDMHTVQAAYDEFLNHPSLSGKASIPVQLAQEMKQATYKSVGGKAYGEMKSADVEAQKALARGLKDEIAKSVPEVRKLNAEDSKLLTTLPLVERRVLMDANKNPIGLGWMTLNPAKFAGWMADRSPGFKSVVAHMLNAGSETAGKVGKRATQPGFEGAGQTATALGAPPLSLAPAGERIPSLPRDQGRAMPPMTLARAQMMNSSPGAGIPRPPMETIPAHGLYQDVHEAQRAALERQLAQGQAYRHEPFQPQDQLGRPSDNWSTSPGAGGSKSHPGIPAHGLYDPLKRARPDPKVLEMLGIDFHPTPIADAEGYVARTHAEQEALRDPGVRASKAAQKKAAEERAAKAKKNKDADE